MFLKDVWPSARIGLYCELYHRATYPHVGFDPEFDKGAQDRDVLRLRLRNINNFLHFDIAEAGLSPTAFQADTFPQPFRDKITVRHDGIDTDVVCPNPAATLRVNDALTLTRQDEVITFINRNLEPYHGYHIFMRALPRLLRDRPNAQIVVLGGMMSVMDRARQKVKHGNKFLSTKCVIKFLMRIGRGCISWGGFPMMFSCR